MTNRDIGLIFFCSLCLRVKEIRNWVSVSNLHVIAYHFSTCVCQIPCHITVDHIIIGGKGH